MYVMFVIELLLLVGGGLLCAKGLKLYKVMQMIICGAIGAYLGLNLSYSIGRKELYLAALILTVLGGYLGYRYYKASLFVTATICSFMVVFSYFWKKAITIANQGAGQIKELQDIITEGTKGGSSAKGVGNSINQIMFLQEQNVTAIAKAASDVIRHGLLIAIIVGCVAGLLTIVMGDLLIMMFTSAFGALMLSYLVEIFIKVNPAVHMSMVLIIALVGVIYQGKHSR